MGKVLNDRFMIMPGEPAPGGLSLVHGATDGETGERVAVKILRHDVASEQDERLIYERELQSLQRLRHDNIVRLIDHGIHEGERFLVLEWMDSTLQDFLAAWRDDPDWGWDTFAATVALPLLGALEHAHECEIVHRDIKPSNVLIDADGTPKLADFGISKLKSQLISDGTLLGWQSAPYSPPDRASQSNYSRDVFAFGLLAINCVSDAPADDYPEIEVALNELDAPLGILKLLGRCVSLDPEERPANASVLAAEFGHLQEPRLKGFEDLPAVHLVLTRKLRECVSPTAHPISDEEARRIVLNDLSMGATVEWQFDRDKNRLSEEYLAIFGEEWWYGAVKDSKGPKLVLTTARRLRQHQMDRGRDKAWEPPFEFKLTPPIDHSRAESVLHDFFLRLDEFHVAREHAWADSEARRLFGQWHGQLRALEQVARGSLRPIRYEHIKKEGRRLYLRLDQEPEEELLEQERAIEQDDGRQIASGVVEEVDGDVLTLYLDKSDVGVPRRGRLVADTRSTLRSLQRQREALLAVQHEDSGVVRPELREMLIRPDGAAAPRGVEELHWLQEGLDEDKRQAVAQAMGTRDFMLVEGPPGTGKTTFIAELVGQTLCDDPDARILVSSQTHVALDNALERISELLPDIRLIRLARSGDPRVSEDVHGLLIDAQMAEWVKAVRRRSEEFLREWATAHGADLKGVRTALTLTELIAVKRQSIALQSEAHEVREQLRRYEEAHASDGDDETALLTEDEATELRESLSEYGDRLGQLKRERDRLIPELRRALDLSLERLEEVSPEELETMIPKAVERTGNNSGEVERIVRLQGEWLERVGRGAEFHAALLHATEVVAGTCIGLAGFSGMNAVPFDLCILDEASKATATEALVPFVRAKKWVLVGDRRQLPPFLDDALTAPEIADKFDLDLEELPQTLFDRLADGLPPSARTMLRTQHRMVRPIGELVSDCFYDGQLLSATEAAHPDLDLALEAPVTWVDTSALPSHHDRSAGAEGLSFVNRAEASVIAERLKRLDFIAQTKGWAEEHGRTLSVLVLTGYRPQVTAIRQSIAAQAGGMRFLTVEANTVDAAQGREADIAIFSVTRSNSQGRGGFLTASPRINVALSRGRHGLTIVGDLPFCAGIGGPLARVVSYLRAGPIGTTIVAAEA